MKFEVDDEAYIPGEDYPPVIGKILKTIQSMPDGKLYTTKRLAREAGYTRDTVCNHTAHPVLAEYKIIVRGGGTKRNLFGNANTIQAYRKEFKDER